MPDTSARLSLALPLAADGGQTFYTGLHTNFEIIDAAIGTEVCGEDATGMIIGTALTIPHTPIANTYRLFKNGVRLKEGAGDGFTRSGDAVTLTTAIESGDWFCHDYKY